MKGGPRWGLALAGLVAGLLAGGQARAQAQPAGRVVIEFTFDRIPKIASNQIAVWIEDEQGRYVATVFATRFTAAGGYKRRPDALPAWVGASDWKNASKSEVEAVSRSTPREGTVRLSWDCTDRNGRRLAPGTYTIRLEAVISWKARVLWSGTIRVGEAASESTLQPVYEPADAAGEGVPIRDVEARYSPG